jgi:hypothetical protein
MKPVIGLLTVLTILLAFHVPALQTIPNGADHYYMRDVGETQLVLNTWGTLHFTGYPLYVIAGNLLVTLFRTVGIAPATAAAVVSLLWSMVALALIYALALHLTNPTRQPPPRARRGGVTLLPAMLVTLLFGLTRTVWIHAVIAEVYSFGLALLALSYLLALWREPIPYRLYWLALVGGIGVSHHRALILAAPALLYAVWPELTADRRRLVRIIPLCVLIGLLGFLPYLYLPLRAQANANWVYGNPDTWGRFWEQFTGSEADQFMGLPDSLQGLVANFNTVNTVLVTDLTAVGIVLGVFGLLLALRSPQHRRPAITFLVGGLIPYGLHVALYTDILSAMILPITLSLVFGWLFLADWLIGALPQRLPSLAPAAVLVGVSVVGVVVLTNQNRPFITDLTTDTTGLDAIAVARNTPPGATLMLAWGVRHTAVGFARDVSAELPDIPLVDHKGDYGAIISRGMLVTPQYTFYNQPGRWWEEQLGVRVYLRAVAPDLVQIDTQPEYGEMVVDATAALDPTVHCDAGSIILEVDWYAPVKPDRDLSVFVHLLDSNGRIIAQADQSAPVYGWRPLTSWEAGEVVHDVYSLPRLDSASAIQYGLYQQLPSGEFVNESAATLPVECGDD